MFKKWLIISAAVIAVLGVIVSFAGFALADFDVEKLYKLPEVEEKTFTAQGEIFEISIDTDCPVTVCGAKTQDCVVTYTQNDLYTVSVSQTGGRLSITQNADENWTRQFKYGFFGLCIRNRCGVTVTVPEGYSGSIKINSDNDDISISSLLAVASIECDSHNGTVTVSDVTVTRLSCEGRNGKLSFSRLSAQNLEAACNNGSIDISNVTVSQSVFASTHNGKITVTDTDATNLTASTSNGNIKMSFPGAREDYTIITETHNGDCNEESRSGGPKTINATTHNGNISINFEK